MFEYRGSRTAPKDKAGRKTLRRAMGAPGHDGTTFKLYETPTTRTGRARRPTYIDVLPSSHGDATGDRERDVTPAASRKVVLPVGEFFTVRRSREGELTHGSPEGSHAHRTVTYEWYSPRSPAAVLTYTRETGSPDMDTPPARPRGPARGRLFRMGKAGSVTGKREAR